jgi:hypothetical protein
MEETRRLHTFFMAALCILLVQCSPQSSQTAEATNTPQDSTADIPAQMHLVQPIQKDSIRMETNQNAQSGGDLRIGQGQFFSYAMPEGWRVGEDGQFALTLMAPDNKALTFMVGNSGYPANYPPAQFVYEKLMGIHPENLQLSQPRQASTIAGFSYAYQFDVSYSIQGAPCRGSVKCHVAPAYDMCVLAMTAALSDATQWTNYSSWLPLVAEQISATNGAAFGMRGIMQQNLQNSKAFGEALQRYREWSQENWQKVTDQRNASADKQNQEFRETIGNVQPYVDPYNANRVIELPNTYKYYWIDLNGRIAGTDDPTVDPNQNSNTQWSRMNPHRR